MLVSDNPDGQNTATDRTAIEDAPEIPQILRAGFRRTAFLMPFGLIGGALIGLIGGGSDSLEAGESALFVAIIFGFVVLPMLTSAVGAGRWVSRSSHRLRSSLLKAALLPPIISGTFASIGAGLILITGSAFEIHLNSIGVLTTTLTVAMLGSALFGVLATLLFWVLWPNRAPESAS